MILDAVRNERMSVTVVFDGPPPSGAPSRESLGSATVVYSGSTSADDVIIDRLPAGRDAAQWVVVTNDRELEHRARRRGATVRGLDRWIQRSRPTARRPRPESKLSSHEIAEWERYFDRDDRQKDGA
jgi:hypothetical protein